MRMMVLHSATLCQVCVEYFQFWIRKIQPRQIQIRFKISLSFQLVCFYFNSICGSSCNCFILTIIYNSWTVASFRFVAPWLRRVLAASRFFHFRPPHDVISCQVHFRSDVFSLPDFVDLLRFWWVGKFFLNFVLLTLVSRLRSLFFLSLLIVFIVAIWSEV